MSRKTLKIETITPRYDVVEDRIRLSFNHQNMQSRTDFMLTRKFILKLVPSYDEYIFKVYPDSIEKMNTTTMKNKNTRIYNHSKFEAYQNNAMILHGIEFTFLTKDKLTLLKFYSKNVEATVTLNYLELNKLIQLIKSTIPYFDWGISTRI